MASPACTKVMIGHKAECPKCGGMIGTFISKVPGVVVHVLHGKTWPVLDAQHRLLTHKCLLDMWAGLNRAQTHTGRIFGFILNTRIRITGNRAARKDNASVIAVISAVLLEWVLAPEKARWTSAVTTGPNIISILPLGDRAIAHHPVKVSPSTTWVPPSVWIAHPWKSLPLSRVAVRTLGRYGCLALGFGKRKCSGLKTLERSTRDFPVFNEGECWPNEGKFDIKWVSTGIRVSVNSTHPWWTAHICANCFHHNLGKLGVESREV